MSYIIFGLLQFVFASWWVHEVQMTDKILWVASWVVAGCHYGVGVVLVWIGILRCFAKGKK